MRITIPSAVLLGTGLAACAGKGPDSGVPTGRAIAVGVAPLSLPGAEDVCYGVYVENGLGQLVAYKAHVCSADYGNGAGGGVAPSRARAVPGAAGSGQPQGFTYRLSSSHVRPGPASMSTPSRTSVTVVEGAWASHGMT